MCPAALAGSEKGRDGPQATLLEEHEGGRPRSPCPLAPELDTNQAVWLPAWLCGQNPLALIACQTHKNSNCAHTPAPWKSPGLPAKSELELRVNPHTLLLDGGVVWVQCREGGCQGGVLGSPERERPRGKGVWGERKFSDCGCIYLPQAGSLKNLLILP